MKEKASATVVLACVLALAPDLMAGPSPLPLRLESTCINNGSTCKSIETTYGTNLAALPFTGTTTYDFYSPRLLTAASLTTADRAAGTIYMANTSGTTDFSVAGRMAFYDYDPSTGNETFLADTGPSAPAPIKHGGKAASFALPKTALAANKTVSAGHLLHIALTVTLVPDKGVVSGQLLYNGAQDSSTVAYLPQNNFVAWNFAAPSTRLCLAASANGCKQLSCAATPGQLYTVQASTSLSSPNWLNIGTATADASGAFGFTDLAATNFPCRFYRLVAP